MEHARAATHGFQFCLNCCQFALLVAFTALDEAPAHPMLPTKFCEYVEGGRASCNKVCPSPQPVMHSCHTCALHVRFAVQLRSTDAEWAYFVCNRLASSNGIKPRLRRWLESVTSMDHRFSPCVVYPILIPLLWHDTSIGVMFQATPRVILEEHVPIPHARRVIVEYVSKTDECAALPPLVHA